MTQNLLIITTVMTSIMWIISILIAFDPRPFRNIVSAIFCSVVLFGWPIWIVWLWGI